MPRQKRFNPNPEGEMDAARMRCIFPKCRKRSLGPRHHFLCEGHLPNLMAYQLPKRAHWLQWWRAGRRLGVS